MQNPSFTHKHLPLISFLLLTLLSSSPAFSEDIIQFGDSIRLSMVDGTISNEQAKRALDYATRRYERGEADLSSLRELFRNYDGQHRPELLLLIAKEEFISALRQSSSGEMQDSFNSFMQLWEEYPQSAATAQLAETISRAITKIVTDERGGLVDYTSFHMLDVSLRFGALYKVLTKKTHDNLEVYLNKPAFYRTKPLEINNTNITISGSTDIERVPIALAFALTADAYLSQVFFPVISYLQVGSKVMSTELYADWDGKRGNNCRMIALVGKSIFNSSSAELYVDGDKSIDKNYFKIGTIIQKRSVASIRVVIPELDVDVSGTWDLAKAHWRDLDCFSTTFCAVKIFSFPVPEFEKFDLRGVIRKKHGSIYDWTKIEKTHDIL